MPRLVKLAIRTSVLIGGVMGLFILEQYARTSDARETMNRIGNRAQEMLGGLCVLSAGPLILILAGLFAKRKVTVVLCGLVAAAIMAGISWLAVTATGLGSAASGSQEGYRAANRLVWFFGGSLVVYFAVAFARLSRN